jgi:phage terminase small subunit
MSKAPPAPAHLTEATRRWWAQIVKGWTLEAHHLRLLQVACESWDLAQTARAEMKRDGLTVKTINGVKTHPAAAIARDARIVFVRTLREMNLDTEPAPITRAKPSASLRRNASK